MYYHKEKTHVCKHCGKRFPFASQLETHKLVHREKPNQVCMYPNCGRRFKNKSDLNRHAATHTKPWLKCPDCPNYKTKEKRNFESHRLTHNKIKRYNCEKCGEEFTFNTQKLRHIAKKKVLNALLCYFCWDRLHYAWKQGLNSATSQYPF